MLSPFIAINTQSGSPDVKIALAVPAAVVTGSRLTAKKAGNSALSLLSMDLMLSVSSFIEKEGFAIG